MKRAKDDLQGKKTEMPDNSKVGGQKFTVKGGIAGFSGGKGQRLQTSPGTLLQNASTWEPESLLARERTTAGAGQQRGSVEAKTDLQLERKFQLQEYR